MSRRNPLPPPPPTVELRAWPDREALLADRARAMGELSRLSIGVSRLLLLWLTVAGFAVGWSLIGAALAAFEESIEPLSYLFGGIFACIGAACMIPTGVVIGFGIRRDKLVRERLGQWSSLERDPLGDARLRSPGQSLLWFVPSLLLGALGLWMCFAIPATAKPGQETYAEVALLMGLGFILWLTGLIGVAKAVSHYRWAVRLVGAGSPTVAVGAAHT
ncbi:hypothetical protein ACFO9E_01540 [Streptomyces maoxianensis]|uniref:Uncharacterized protein n=1 Tax=Streptomyces maoxianensis TaxID=1459942 RepID=A0ABV9FWZ0_9ACTN